MILHLKDGRPPALHLRSLCGLESVVIFFLQGMGATMSGWVCLGAQALVGSGGGGGAAEEGFTRTHATTLQRTPATKGPLAGPGTAGTDSTERTEADTSGVCRGDGGGGGQVQLEASRSGHLKQLRRVTGDWP